MMTISAFGDEAAVDFEEQLQILQNLNIPCIDVRKAWAVTCTDFTSEHIQKINALCEQYGITVACMGSPIGKSPIQQSLDYEIHNLKRIADTAHKLGTKNIRMFSFYPEADITDVVMANAIDRLKQLTDLADELDVQLLLENEKGLVGDTPERVKQILQTIESPRLRLIWDPANFVQCGAENQVDKWWEQLQPYIAYIHIKDALLNDGTVKPAGEGDGQLKQLLQHLNLSGYAGILSLEPHLVVAGHSSGFSGAEGMEIAANALRKLMSEVRIQEA